jgi:RimJ/RimL family protein N-acetyltransferase
MPPSVAATERLTIRPWALPESDVAAGGAQFADSHVTRVGGHRVRRQRGRGHATGAALGCLPHGFEVLGLDRIVAAVDPRDTASLSVIERRRMPAAGSANDPSRPLVRFALTAEGVARAHPSG